MPERRKFRRDLPSQPAMSEGWDELDGEAKISSEEAQGWWDAIFECDKDKRVEALRGALVWAFHKGAQGALQRMQNDLQGALEHIDRKVGE